MYKQLRFLVYTKTCDKVALYKISCLKIIENNQLII